MSPLPGRQRLLLCLALASAASAIFAQSATSQSATSLGRKIRKGDEAEQVQAAIAIGALGPKGAKAVPDLVWGIANGTEQLRTEAVRAVGLIGKKAVPYLKKVLNKKDDPVRIAAMLTIPQLGADTKPLQPIMRKLWRYERVPLSTAIDDAFVGLGAHAVPEMIKGVEDFAHQHRACAVLGRIGKPARPAMPVLLELLHSKGHGRSAAAQPLGAIQDPSVMPHLIEVVKEATTVIDSSCDHAASGCARALGGFGPKAAHAVPALLNLMEAERPANLNRMCSEAAWALADIGVRTPEVLERLHKVASTATGELKKGALDSIELLEMGKTASRAALLRGMHHQSTELQLLALKEVVKRGTAAKSLAKSTARLLKKDPEIAVRLAAVAALMAMGDAHDDVIDSLKGAAKSPDTQLAKAAKDALVHLGK